MRKIIVTLLITASVAALVLTGCTKKEEGAGNSSAKSVSKSHIGVNFYTQKPWVRLSIWETTDKDKKRADLLNPGQTLEIVFTDSNGDGVKDAVLTQEGVNYGKPATFIKVRTEYDTEGWAPSNLVAVDAKPAVMIKEKTYLYTAKSETKISKLKITKAQLVAVYDEGNNEKFVKVAISNGTVYTMDYFMSKKCLSFDKSDIIAAETLLLADSNYFSIEGKEGDAKTEAAEVLLSMIDSRMDDMVGSALFSDVQDIKFGLETIINGEEEEIPMGFEGEEEVAVVNLIEQGYDYFFINDEKVNVRSSASIDADIIIQKNTNDIVKIVSISDSPVEVNGVINYWYEIELEKEGSTGWVFGLFIDGDLMGL